MIDALQDFVSSLPALVQWAGVMLVSAIPFVESYFGSIIGVVAGIHPAAAIIAAVAGNVISMLAFVLPAAGAREAVRRKHGGEESPRRERLRRAFDKYGVAGVSLVGQWILPSQITSAAMVGFGANRNKVILWQMIAIALWGVVFGTLAAFGIQLRQG